MPLSNTGRVAYVLKRYPRYSETFIINEILAHEAAGQELEIFSLRSPTDTFFAEQIQQVRAPVTYLAADGKASEFWAALENATQDFPRFRSFVTAARDEEALTGCQAMMLAGLAKQRGIRHFHAHFATSATAVARLAARLTGGTYSFTAHAKDIFHDSVDASDLKRKLDDAQSVITVSDYNRQYLRTTFGAAADRVHRVYNGLDLSRFQFQSPNNRPALVVAVGRLVEKKGFADLVDACQVLKKLGREFTCEIIGGGELESTLRVQVRQSKLEDRVVFRGPLPSSDVIALIRKAAVVAVPCVLGSDGNRDGLPTVLLEAMALGTPCVSTDVTGIPEVLHHNETGLLVGQHQPHDLATAIAQLMENSTLRVRLASAARELIEREYDIHSNTAKMRSIIFRSTALRRRRPRAQFQEAG